jgi:hypothetical protein
MLINLDCSWARSRGGYVSGTGSKPESKLKSRGSHNPALISKGGRMPYTGDEVFWSGAMKRPAVGSQKPEYFAVEEPGKRTNQKVVNIVVDRLELAASGDMALEFSHSTLDCDGAGNTADHTKMTSPN